MFTCEKIDESLFEKKYPQLYETYKDRLKIMDRGEVEEILPDNDSADSLALREEAVFLHFDNGETISIYNTELIEFNGTYFDGFSVYADSDFAYFLISVAAGQAGSLGIWSLADKKWIFTHRDEGLCVEAVIYVPKANCFVGFVEWYQYASPGGESFFFINSDRCYTEFELEKAKEVDWSLISPEIRQDFHNQQDALLGFDQFQSVLYTIKGGERLAYQLDDAKIRALQIQATL